MIMVPFDNGREYPDQVTYYINPAQVACLTSDGDNKYTYITLTTGQNIYVSGSINKVRNDLCGLLPTQEDFDEVFNARKAARKR